MIDTKLVTFAASPLRLVTEQKAPAHLTEDKPAKGDDEQSNRNVLAPTLYKKAHVLDKHVLLSRKESSNKQQTISSRTGISNYKTDQILNAMRRAASSVLHQRDPVDFIFGGAKMVGGTGAD